MQQQHQEEKHEDKADETKEQFYEVEEERAHASHELTEIKKMAEEASSKVDVVLATKKNPEPQTGSNYSVEEAISKIREEEEDIKQNNTESLEHETMKESEIRLKKEMDDVRASEVHAMGLLSNCKRRIQELEIELDKRKESEANLYDSLVMQTKLHEQNKMLLAESKLEIASLKEKVEALQGCAADNMKNPDESQAGLSMKEAVEDPGTQVQLVEKLNGAQEGEQLALKAVTLLEEMSFLKIELKLATEAEENSKKAMDDLALALKEVATEANQTKEKLTLSQVELEHSKGEVENLKAMLKKTEDTYKELLDETRKEADRYKNISERLRLEAEESLLAWNGKETEFVNCIRRAEEERSAAQKETRGLVESLAVAENKTKVSKEENQKLRDILKQALNEANVAKEAAEIAKAENSQLQDTVAKKDVTLNLLAQENEILKIHEAAAFDNIRELKRLLSEAPIKELKNEDKEKSSTKESNKEDKEVGNKAKAADKDHSRSLSKTFSFNLKDIISIPIPHKQHKEGNEDPNKETDDDALTSSIFDELSTADPASHQDGDIVSSDDCDPLDESHFDDTENNSRKRRALLRRFGDLIRRRGYHRKEPANEERLNT